MSLSHTKLMNLVWSMRNKSLIVPMLDIRYVYPDRDTVTDIEYPLDLSIIPHVKEGDLALTVLYVMREHMRMLDPDRYQIHWNGPMTGPDLEGHYSIRLRADDRYSTSYFNLICTPETASAIATTRYAATNKATNILMEDIIYWKMSSGRTGKVVEVKSL